MAKRVIFIGISIIILISLVAAFLLLRIGSAPPEDFPKYYTPEPESWVSDEVNFEKSNITTIDVDKATESQSVIIGDHQRIVTGQGILSLYYYGAYEGNDFTTTYIDPRYLNESEGKTPSEMQSIYQRYTKMRISETMVSGDGVIEGIIIGKIEGQNIDFYIFLDQDWKDKVPYTNIIIGEDTSDKDTLRFFPFRFDKIDKGVYIQKVTGQVSWFRQNPNNAFVVVGDITTEQLAKGSVEKKTIMMIG